MWFAYSLATIGAWAFSDLFSKKGTRAEDRYSALRLVAMVGLVMGLHAAFVIFVQGVAYDPSSFLAYLPVSFLYILSMALGYVGLRYIELSVSSPICNSSGAVVALLCFLFLGQRMSGLQLAAVLMICAGIFLLALLEKRQADEERRAAGEKVERKYVFSAIAILFPILYCVIDGLGGFMDALVLQTLDEEQANLSYELTFLLVSLCAMTYLFAVKRQRMSLKAEGVFTLGALAETTGQFFYIQVMAMEGVAIYAAPMIASYSIFSVLLSRIFLKEKLSGKQYAVIGLVMAGIAILGLGDG